MFYLVLTIQGYSIPYLVLDVFSVIILQNIKEYKLIKLVENDR